MRLTSFEQSAIKSTVLAIDPEAKVFVFGSRTNDAASGGDIDLLVESKTINFSKKLEILAEIKRLIGEQKIDLILTNNLKSDDSPFVKCIQDSVRQL